METSLLGRILLANIILQMLVPSRGPAAIESSFNHIRALVWQLQQTNPNHATYSQVWRTLDEVGEQDWQVVKYQYGRDKNEYSIAFWRMQDSVNRALLPLQL
jgi:hypothetical protein